MRCVNKGCYTSFLQRITLKTKGGAPVLPKSDRFSTCLDFWNLPWARRGAAPSPRGADGLVPVSGRGVMIDASEGSPPRTSLFAPESSVIQGGRRVPRRCPAEAVPSRLALGRGCGGAGGARAAPHSAHTEQKPPQFITHSVSQPNSVCGVTGHTLFVY